MKKRIRTCLRVSAVELARGITGLRFWLVTACFTVIMLLDTLPEFYAGKTLLPDGSYGFYNDILGLDLIATAGGSYLFWLRFCLYVIPYGCCFYEEYSNGAAKYRFLRSADGSYGLSKLLSCILLTGLSIWLSEFFYMLLMLLQGASLLLPVDGWYNSAYLYNTYQLVAGGHILGFWLLLSIFKCFAGIFFSTLTLVLSTFIRNKFILIAMPLTIFFSFDSLCGLLFGRTQPDWTNWRVLFFSMSTGEPMSEVVAVIRTMLYTLVTVVIFGYIFMKRIRGVCESE